jgi:DNA polymerase-3 subunit delta
VFFVDRSFAWDEFRQETQSLSLFAERRLFELRMPGKPDKGAAVLIDLATRPPPDMVCLVLTDKLDKKASESPWVRAFEKHGVWVPIWPVSSSALPAWLRAREQLLGVEMEPDAAQLIVDRVEGNLLAAKQELEKLVLLSATANASVRNWSCARWATVLATTYFNWGGGGCGRCRAYLARVARPEERRASSPH